MGKIKKSIVFISAFLVAILTFNGCYLIDKFKSNDSKQPSDLSISSKPKVKKSNTKFKDGSYQVAKKFTTEGGEETMNLKVLIENDKIKHVFYEGDWDNEVSESINEGFGPKLVQNAIGKGVDDEIDAVSGATLSSKAFTEAITEAFRKAE